MGSTMSGTLTYRSLPPVLPADLRCRPPADAQFPLLELPPQPLPAPQDELRRSDEYEESFEEEN